MRLNHYLELPEFLITCSLIAALKYVNINECLGQKRKKRKKRQYVSCVSWAAAEMWVFPRAQSHFQSLHSSSKCFLNKYFSAPKVVHASKVGGWWAESPVRHPLNLSLLGSLLFPLPGGCGACEE